MPVLTEELVRLKGHRWQVSSLSCSPDGSRFASGGWDKEIHVRNLATPETKSILKGEHLLPITSVCWQKPHGNIICSGSADGTAILWDVTHERCIGRLQDHRGWVLGTAFSSDGTCIATACWDSLVRLWSLGSPRAISEFAGHTKGVWSVDFHPLSSNEACSGGEDGNILLWDTRRKSSVATLSDAHSGAIYCTAWSPDGSIIATGSTDTKVCIWETRTRSMLKSIQGHTDTVKSIAFNPQQQNVAIPVVASAGGFSVRLSDLRPSYKSELLTLSPHMTGKEVEAVTISPDGSLLASGGRDGLIILHNLFVPSVASRSESFRSSSAFVRTSRLFNSATDDDGVEAEVEAIENLLSDAVVESKSFERLKRLSRTEDREVELPSATEKRKGSSTKKSREERSKGKPTDVLTTIPHFSTLNRQTSKESTDITAIRVHTSESNTRFKKVSQEECNVQTQNQNTTQQVEEGPLFTGTYALPMRAPLVLRDSEDNEDEIMSVI